MSTKISNIVWDENITPENKTFSDDMARMPERRTLATIQPSSTPLKVMHNKKLIVKSNDDIDHSFSEHSVEGQNSDEVLNLLTSDEPCENYWKLLAEERRIAICELLEENADLKEDIHKLDNEYQKLKCFSQTLVEKTNKLELLVNEYIGSASDLSDSDDI